MYANFLKLACLDSLLNPPLYLCSALFSELEYFNVLMDLNKVYIYMVALPKPLSQAAKWGKGRWRRVHPQLNRYNEATCWLVSIKNSCSTVCTRWNMGVGTNWMTQYSFIYVMLNSLHSLWQRKAMSILRATLSQVLLTVVYSTCFSLPPFHFLLKNKTHIQYLSVHEWQTEHSWRQ